ncbi:MAG TPA: molybdenum cofactor biosynthesis protein MoaE [Candidatus Limnocylindrales bacterium]|nr:molybdenum cofactor biosynthesis protein MoaE [Candidatus Limnocylindrales bacterium]
MREGLLVRISAGPLDPGEAVAAVADPGAGATCLFLGTVRDHSEEGAVTGLSYEAWDEIAVIRLEQLGDELFDTWPLCKVALLHRTGDLEVGEVSVVVACSSAHREEAFEACRHAIDRLKADAPIWKKEHLVAGGSHWVMGA